MLNEEYITFDFNLILDLGCKRKNQIKIDLKTPEEVLKWTPTNPALDFETNEFSKWTRSYVTKIWLGFKANLDFSFPPWLVSKIPSRWFILF